MAFKAHQVAAHRDACLQAFERHYGPLGQTAQLEAGKVYDQLAGMVGDILYMSKANQVAKGIAGAFLQAYFKKPQKPVKVDRTHLPTWGQD